MKIVLYIVLILSLSQPLLHTQEPPPIAIQPTATREVILAVADAQPATPENAGELKEALRTFNQVLRDDLRFSGYFTVAAKDFYPPQPIVHPELDINYDDWDNLPFKVDFLATGTLRLTGGVLRVEVKIYDMKLRKWSGIGQGYTGDVSDVRTIAHWWADEIVYKLTAGTSRGIASTRIAYVSKRGKAKEIYMMDYDGYNQQAFTRNGSSNLFPNWAPDNSKLAFVSYRTGQPEINIYSITTGSRLPFPIFNTLASTPAISPSGTEIAFSLRSIRPLGDPDIFISKLDGSSRRNLTNNPAIDTSPTWSPEGRRIAFVSNRQGSGGQIYYCDIDGSNLQRIIKEGGDADSPAWSPDGKWIAFHWKPRLSINYDLFLYEVGSGNIRQLTSNAGSNESPSWAPDGQHLAFESDRTGTKQIYILLLGEDEPLMLTRNGVNTSPAWSGYFRKDTEN